MTEISLKIETSMYLGILPSEKKRRNRVKMNIKCSYDPENGFVDYREIYREALLFAKSGKHSTIEEFARQSGKMLLEKFPALSSIEFETEKLSPPMMPECTSVSSSVHMERKRKS